MKSLKVYTDGACNGNPGSMAIGYVICSSQNKILHQGSKFIADHGTNNIAEYSAIIIALGYILNKYTCKEIKFYTDSKLVANQMTGKWRIKKPHLHQLKKKIVNMIQSFDRVSFHWIPRSHPKIMLADSLAGDEIMELIKSEMGAK